MQRADATIESVLYAFHAHGDTSLLLQYVQKRGAALLLQRLTEAAVTDEKLRVADLIAFLVDSPETRASLTTIEAISLLLALLGGGNAVAMAAVRALTRLVVEKNTVAVGACRSRRLGYVVDLVRGYQRGDEELLVLVLALLDALAADSLSVPWIIESGILETVAALIPVSPTEIQLASVTFLTKLVNRPDARRRFVQTSALDCCVSVLESDSRQRNDQAVRTASIKLVDELVDDAVCLDAVATKTTLLVAAIRDGQESEQDAALDVVLRLISQSYVTTTLDAGFVEVLAQMITAKDRRRLPNDQIENLVMMLWAEATRTSRAAAVAIVDAMLECAQSNSRLSGQAVVATIASWVESWEYPELLLQSRLVKVAASTAMKYIDGESAPGAITPRSALDMLWTMSLYDNFAKSMDEEVTHALIAVLKNPTSQLREQCAMVLYNVSWSHAPLRPVLGASGCLNIFVDMLRDGTKGEKDAAAGALAAACLDCERNTARLPHNELLDLCVIMLLTGEGDAPNAALRLVKSLADDPSIGEDVARHSTIVSLTIQCLSREDDGNRLHAALAIESFARYFVSRQQMVEAGVETALRNIRRGGSRMYARSALHALSNSDA